MTGKTNNEIVEIVYRTYKIKSLILKMVDYSNHDKSCDDLEQYIYEQLLRKPNNQLNQLYNDNKLRNYISQIISHQRNGGVELKDNRKTSVYHKQFKLGNNQQITNEEYEDDLYNNDIDNKFDFINNELGRYISWWGLTGLTRSDERLALGAKFLTFTIDRKIKMIELVPLMNNIKNVKTSSMLKNIWNIISDLKKKLRDDFNNNNDNF